MDMNKLDEEYEVFDGIKLSVYVYDVEGKMFQQLSFFKYAFLITLLSLRKDFFGKIM